MLSHPSHLPNQAIGDLHSRMLKFTQSKSPIFTQHTSLYHIT